MLCIGGVQWEILIREYKRQIINPFKKTSDYIDSFFDFIDSIGDVKNSQSENILVAYVFHRNVKYNFC